MDRVSIDLGNGVVIAVLSRRNGPLDPEHTLLPQLTLHVNVDAALWEAVRIDSRYVALPNILP